MRTPQTMTGRRQLVRVPTRGLCPRNEPIRQRIEMMHLRLARHWVSYSCTEEQSNGARSARWNARTC